MIPTITINGTPAPSFGLLPLEGTLDALMRPAQMKTLVYNDNASIDGSRAITAGRKMQRRDVTLMFKLTASSLKDLADRTDTLISSLTSGKDGTGINELSVAELGRTYRLVYQGFDTYSNFDVATKVTLSIKFTELNPKNNK